MTIANTPANAVPNPSNRFEIRAGSRLHLGLVEIHSGAPNCFGGIGWMVEEPSSRVRFDVAECALSDLQIDAPTGWRDRVLELCRRWLTANPTCGKLPIRRVSLESTQRPHQGLGSGTQWSSMISHALCAAVCSDPTDYRMSLEQLASLSGRGLRSFIGLTGYVSGGAIIDFGHAAPEELPSSEGSLIFNGRVPPRRVESIPFPSWPILLICDEAGHGEFGDSERKMFQACSQQANPGRELMLSLIHQQLIPALQTSDWERWDGHIGQYGALAGKIFERVQGGVYRSQSIQSVIETCKRLGYRGAAQSSWGPTVALAVRDLEEATGVADELSQRLAGVRVTLTEAKNQGSAVARLVGP